VLGALALIVAASLLPSPAPFAFWLAIPLYLCARVNFGGELPFHGTRELLLRLALAGALTLAAGVICQLFLGGLVYSLRDPDRLYPVLGTVAVAVGLCIAQWRTWPFLGLLFLSRLAGTDLPQDLYARLTERARELTLGSDDFWSGGVAVAASIVILLILPSALHAWGDPLDVVLAIAIQGVALALLIEVLLRLTERARRRPRVKSSIPSFLLDGAFERKLPAGSAAAPSEPLDLPPSGPAHELLLAARHGDSVGVKQALAQGADPNALPLPQSADQRTPLIAAATAVELGALRALIAAGAEVNRVSGGLTALLAATRDSFDGRISAVMTLLANGADPNLADDAGNTPLHFAASTRDAAVMQSLLDAGARLDGVNREGMTPLALACEASNQVVIDYLIKRGALPDVDGTSPALLFAAAVDGDDARGVKRLLKAKARVDARGPHGRSALMVAALADNAEIADALLAAGADVDAIDDTGSCALLEAARAGANRVLQRLVFHKPNASRVDPHARNALHLAARAGNADAQTVQLLLTLGCDPTTLDNNGRTAAEIAAMAGRWPLVRELDPEYPIPSAHRFDESDEADALAIQPDPPGRLLVRSAMQGRFPLFQELLDIPGVTSGDIAEALVAAVTHVDRRYAEAVSEAGYDTFERLENTDSVWERLCASRPTPVTMLAALIERAERSSGASANLLVGLCACEMSDDNMAALSALRERAIALGAQVNAVDRGGRPPLFNAVRSLPMEWIERLIAIGADPNMRDPRADTALTQLAWAQRIDAREIAPVLIRAGADPALAARDGSTAAGVARLTGQMELAALLEWPAGAHPGHALTGAAVAAAGRRGDLTTIDRLLSLGLDVDGVDAQGASAILHAAGTGQIDLVRALIERGADIRLVSERKISPAAAAILSGRNEVLELLISRGVGSEEVQLGRLTLLGLAAACLRLPLVDALLRKGADPDGLAAPESPLENVLNLVFDISKPIAPILSVLERLAEGGANADRPDSTGLAALLRLLGSGRVEPQLRDELRLKPVLLALVQSGANPNAIDADGRTALHWACKHGLVNCGGILLELGADPRVVDHNRQMPIDLLSPRYRIHLGPVLRQASEAWNRQRGPRLGA